MELKKFEAPTLAEALKVIKMELGPEAIILKTKNKRSGWGLMNGSSVEVTAAVSYDALERKEVAERALSEKQIENIYRNPHRKASQSYDVLSGSRLRRQIRETEASDSQEEISYPKNKIHRPITQRRYIDIRDDDSPAEILSASSNDQTRFEQLSPPTKKSEKILPKILAKLIDAGIEHSIVKGIGDEIKVIMLREHLTDESQLMLRTAKVLMSRLRVAKPLSERLRVPSTPRMITFIGPTGVGKTTTLAKIAAELVLNQKKRVVLATTDTYKIAAVEQLQTYANILKISLEVCPTEESLIQLEEMIEEDEVVLVDTAGFGPRDKTKIQELRDSLSVVRTETHLCVSSTTRDVDLQEVLQRYTDFEPDYLVFTKTDETASYGNILNLNYKSQVPLSYLTMGQRVPEDIEVATKERIADLILDLTEGD